MVFRLYRAFFLFYQWCFFVFAVALQACQCLLVALAHQPSGASLGGAVVWCAQGHSASGEGVAL